MVFCIGERPNDNIVPFARVTGYDHLGNSWVVESEDLRTLYAHLNPGNPENEENIERVNQERDRQEREERDQQERESERQEPERDRHQEHVSTSRKLLNELLDDHDIYINSDVEPVNAKYLTQSEMHPYRDALIHGTKGGVDIFGWVNKDHPVDVCVPGNRLLVVMDANTSPRQLRPLDTCYSESARESCASLDHEGTVAIIPNSGRTFDWYRDLGGSRSSVSGNCDVERDVRELVEPAPQPEPAWQPVPVKQCGNLTRKDGSVVHVVQPGHHCWGIAKACGISMEDIQQHNPEFGDCTMLYPGDELVVVAPPADETRQELIDRGYWISASKDVDFQIASGPGIGNEKVLAEDPVDAVDIRGEDVGEYEFCFKETGIPVFLDASGQGERELRTINSRHDDQNRTCVSGEGPGTIVLLPENDSAFQLWVAAADFQARRSEHGTESYVITFSKSAAFGAVGSLGGHLLHLGPAGEAAIAYMLYPVDLLTGVASGFATDAEIDISDEILIPLAGAVGGVAAGSVCAAIVTIPAVVAAAPTLGTSVVAGTIITVSCAAVGSGTAAVIAKSALNHGETVELWRDEKFESEYKRRALANAGIEPGEVDRLRLERLLVASEVSDPAMLVEAGARELPQGCTVKTTGELDFLAWPSPEAGAKAGELPSGAVITASLKSQDGSWYYVDYHGEKGWISTSFAILDNNLNC